MLLKRKSTVKKIVVGVLSGITQFLYFGTSNSNAAGCNTKNSEKCFLKYAKTCLDSSFAAVSRFLGTKKEVGKKHVKTVYMFGSPSTGKSNKINKLTGSNFETGEMYGVTTAVNCVDTYLSKDKIKFCDTPGLHKNANKDELQGIEEAKKRLHEADVVIVGINVSKKLEDQSIDEIMQSLAASKSKNDKQKFIFDLARSDKIKDETLKANVINNFKNALKERCDSLNCIFVVTDTDSAESMERLKKELLSKK